MSLIKLKNNALDNLTSFTGSASLGDMVFISSATASASASIEFSLGSYKEYKFFFVNIHPSVDNAEFGFNLSVDSGSNYNVTKTSSGFVAYHNEGGTDSSLGYDTQMDLAQGTGLQLLTRDLGSDNDQNASGYLHLFNPSSDIFVKHYLGVCNEAQLQDYIQTYHIAGYANTVSPLTNIRFSMSSGNIDDGKILCFGIN